MRHTRLILAQCAHPWPKLRRSPQPTRHRGSHRRLRPQQCPRDAVSVSLGSAAVDSSANAPMYAASSQAICVVVAGVTCAAAAGSSTVTVSTNAAPAAAGGAGWLPRLMRRASATRRQAGYTALHSRTSAGRSPLRRCSHSCAPTPRARVLLPSSPSLLSSWHLSQPPFDLASWPPATDSILAGACGRSFQTRRHLSRPNPGTFAHAYLAAPSLRASDPVILLPGWRMNPREGGTSLSAAVVGEIGRHQRPSSVTSACSLHVVGVATALETVGALLHTRAV